MRTMNVCEDREYLNHKDREEESAQRRKCSPEYRDYERESTRRSRKRKCPLDEQSLEEGGEKADARKTAQRSSGVEGRSGEGGVIVPRARVPKRETRQSPGAASEAVSSSSSRRGIV
jgi:hypothetical protein